MRKVFESADIASVILEFCVVDDIKNLYDALHDNLNARNLLLSAFHRLNKLFISINASRKNFNEQVAWSSKFISRLPEIYFINPSASSSMSSSATNLASLNLNDRSFCNLITSFEFLKVICMSDESNGKNITKSFRRLNTLLGTLTELNLKLLSNLQDKDLRCFCEKGPNHLRLLNLMNAHKISDVGIDSVAKASKHLQYLDISECARLTDESVKSLTTHCTNLKELNLSGIVELTDNSLLMLSTYCKNLSVLDLCDVGNVTDKGIDSLAKGCRFLTQLDLSLCVNITNKSLLSLSTYCKYLSKLSLFWCDLITDEGIKMLCTNGCDKLQDVDISRCSSLTNKAVTLIVKHCNHIVNLDVCENHWITDRSLYVILKYGLSKIRNLNISACNNISLAGLHKFIKKQHFRSGALNALDCSFCILPEKLDPTIVRIFEGATRNRIKKKSIICI